jgi:hypothetical protein
MPFYPYRPVATEVDEGQQDNVSMSCNHKGDYPSSAEKRGQELWHSEQGDIDFSKARSAAGAVLRRLLPIAYRRNSGLALGVRDALALCVNQMIAALTGNLSVSSDDPVYPSIYQVPGGGRLVFMDTVTAALQRLAPIAFGSLDCDVPDAIQDELVLCCEDLVSAIEVCAPYYP